MTIIANLLATGCALLLMRKGPTRRLRLLVLTVGLTSLAQTALCLHGSGIAGLSTLPMLPIHQVIVAGLSLFAVYLLGLEVRERNVSERRMRLVEHELHSGETIMEGLSRLQHQVRLQLQLQDRRPAGETKPAVAATVAKKAAPPAGRAPATNSSIHTASVQATSDLLTLLSAVSHEERPVANSSGAAVRSPIQ
jgi:hypothetical protein